MKTVTFDESVWKLVPIEPTETQFGGIARDIIQWLRFTESKNQHSESLVKWLKDMGNEIPDWLYKESEINHLSRHVISKGTIAAIIYKAMLAAAPKCDGWQLSRESLTVELPLPKGMTK